MTRDDIIRLAEKCGIPEFDNNESQADNILRFAALVAAAEREKVARWIMERGYATGHGDTIAALLSELEWQAKEREREACAKVCGEEASRAKWNWDNDLPQNQPFWNGGEQLASSCAAAIRARGQE
jgi:hypothetical protein